MKTVAAAFPHFDNRDGFPLLHEHHLLLNRVQRPGADGDPVWVRWTPTGSTSTWWPPGRSTPSP
ncbi:relaxase domain-containing protein [Streptomyces sp. WMMB303]|uniref:relaxase domain-containing protein n=1 Tax=Streptomyces sp. WMMB303 TaxID=3034154 RepID=UPI0032097769